MKFYSAIGSRKVHTAHNKNLCYNYGNKINAAFAWKFYEKVQRIFKLGDMSGTVRANDLSM